MARRRTLRKKQKTYTKSINKKRKQTYRKMRGGNNVYKIIDELQVILRNLELRKINISKKLNNCKSLNTIYTTIENDITNTNDTIRKAKLRAKEFKATEFKATELKAASENANTLHTISRHSLCCGRRRRKYNKSRRHHKRK